MAARLAATRKPLEIPRAAAGLLTGFSRADPAHVNSSLDCCTPRAHRERHSGKAGLLAAIAATFWGCRTAPPRLSPDIPYAEISAAEAVARPDGVLDPPLERVFLPLDRSFWDLYRRAGGDLQEACLIPSPNSWWEGDDAEKIEPVRALILHHTSMADDESCIRSCTGWPR
jgi:hypothetical protein